jgi:hypothetical protein
MGSGCWVPGIRQTRSLGLKNAFIRFVFYIQFKSKQSLCCPEQGAETGRGASPGSPPLDFGPLCPLNSAGWKFRTSF